MSLPPSLCIDLGASYTKIAYRELPGATSHLLTQSDLPDEHHFCIPSVAARSTTRDAWVFGVEAMDLRSGPRVEVFQDWKSDLFLPEEERGIGFDVLDDTSDEVRTLLIERTPSLRALDVATRFLRWLHDEQLPEMLAEHPRYREAEVQLCVPDFVLDDPLAPRLEALMRAIGFRNEGSFTLSEPKANLIGILTEGQNALTQSGGINVGAMVGDAAVLRSLARPDQAVLLVDVGAFTTDLALASLHRTDAPGTEDPAHSARLGVRRLDDWILEAARPEARARIDGSAAEREHFHRMAFGPQPRVEEFGLSVDHVEATLKRFTDEILAVVDTFLAENPDDHLFSAVLTGGGSNIRGIANRLAAALGQRDIQALHAPGSIDAPHHLRRYALGPELVRGASAIGGCSILYRA